MASGTVGILPRTKIPAEGLKGGHAAARRGDSDPAFYSMSRPASTRHNSTFGILDLLALLANWWLFGSTIPALGGVGKGYNVVMPDKSTDKSQRPGPLPDYLNLDEKRWEDAVKKALRKKQSPVTRPKPPRQRKT